MKQGDILEFNEYEEKYSVAFVKGGEIDATFDTIVEFITPHTGSWDRDGDIPEEYISVGTNQYYFVRGSSLVSKELEYSIY